MRFAPERPWMPFTAEEWFSGSGIDFEWDASVRMAPFISGRVIDRFKHGEGHLSVRVFRWIPVARSRGADTDRGEALRGLAELPWRPFSFADAPGTSWESPGPNRLRATFDDGRTQVSTDFEVDEQGQVLSAGASSRPRMAGKSVIETPWSGTFGEYKMFDGVRAPTVAEVAWLMPDGPFTYWRARVTDFRVLR